MRLNRPQHPATDPAETARVARRRDRVGATAIRLLSMTAVAAAACTLAAGAASASTAHVTKHASKISVYVRPKTANVGAIVNLSATVTSPGRTPTGTVTFKSGRTKLCAGRLRRGKTSCEARFGAAGLYKLRGYYSGNATHKASTSDAIKLKEVRSATTTAITNGNPSTVDAGGSFTFHVAVTSPAGTPAATGKVLVVPVPPEALPLAYQCTATLSGGKGSCTIHPSAAEMIPYEAQYLGNAAHTGSVNKVPFELVVQNVTTTTFTATSAKA